MTAAKDPTENVLDTVRAEGRRQDDLRIAAEKLNDVRHDHSKEMSALRADYEEKLRIKESARLDAIREVDVAAAARATEQSGETATLLANQVQTTAELLRQQFTTMTTGLSERIATLERSSYEGTGKSAVVDPMMARMVEAVEALRTSSASRTGREGLSQPIMMMLVSAATGLVVYLIQNVGG